VGLVKSSINSKRKVLPKREQSIGSRLKMAREALHLTQAEFAREIGISRQRLASYEEARVPLRFDLALRMCRQFVLGEKWLATGEGDMRQCLDLASRGSSYQVAMDWPLGRAYDEHLGAVYEGLVLQFGDTIQIVIRETESFQFLRNYFLLLLDLWLTKLPAARQMPPAFAAELCNMLIKLGWDAVEYTLENRKFPDAENLLGRMLPDTVAKQFAEKATTMLKEQGEKLGGQVKEFVRFQAALEASGNPQSANLKFSHKKEILTDAYGRRKYVDMKSELPGLLKRVAALTKPKGMKTELAKTLGVPPARISEWLGERGSPTADVALKLLRWVERQEAK
jgi:transcriptional regulator with XRE-family HTH domain